jgi:hypothetical protein
MLAMDQKECEFEGAKASANSSGPLTRSSDRENVEISLLAGERLGTLVGWKGPRVTTTYAAILALATPNGGVGGA